VDETDTNERLKQVFRTRHRGTPGLLHTLAVLVAERLNMKKPPTTSIVRYESITIPMDAKTFKEFSFKASTTCQLQPGKPLEIALLERKKMFVVSKDVVRKFSTLSGTSKPSESPRAH